MGSWLIGSWFWQKTPNFYSVFSRENSTVAITIFCAVFFEAVARALDDNSNNRSNTANVRGIRLPFKYKSKNNLSEIHITRPMP